MEVEVGRGRCWAWGWVEKGRWGVGGGEVVAFVVLLGFVVALLGVLVEGWVVVGVYQSVWAWWGGRWLVGWVLGVVWGRGGEGTYVAGDEDWKGREHCGEL